MSDRIAVMTAGRIDQVGTPAEVYEHPRTAFVAGFVGTSNLLTGAVAQAVLGRDGTFAVRPEKITLSVPDEAGADRGSAPEDVTVSGRIAEVIYAGSASRFVVDLDAGARLVVLRQNQQTSSADAAGLRGRTVRLSWRSEHVVAVPTAQPAGEPLEPASHR